MAEVRVIAKFVARKGKEKQLRELLRGMLAPTHAEAGCKSMTCMSQIRRGGFTSTKFGRAKRRSIDTQPARTSSTWSKAARNYYRSRLR